MFNGFSGYQTIPDLLYSMCTISMSLFAQAFYVTFHQEISFTKHGKGDESNLGYRMSEMYISKKTQFNGFISDYVFLCIWGYISGAFLYF